ncbi:hypothetical protein SH1V18_16430 [Vallitalea longa]|uniref:Uncharacterized protein n=1 Tax=Vallitalea longa TaxID=2936439 RepID=A0A9W6DF74_9FIRM|nr:hypothetical protein [Vallitalea longa]GKX29163.1 hypothetical protein SH1V18_16430 [Vallitalea longa]
MKKETYVHKRKILTKIILITIYITFIGYLLGNVQSIADWNYSIHEMLYIPCYIAYYLFPLELCIWLYYAIKSIKEPRDNMMKYNNIKMYLRNSLLVVSVMAILSFFYIQSMNISTTGLFEVENKFNKTNAYYIQINNKNIKCSKNEYNLVKEGDLYMVDFSWNKKWPQKGSLKYIEPTDISE